MHVAESPHITIGVTQKIPLLIDVVLLSTSFKCYYLISAFLFFFHFFFFHSFLCSGNRETTELNHCSNKYKTQASNVQQLQLLFCLSHSSFFSLFPFFLIFNHQWRLKLPGSCSFLMPAFTFLHFVFLSFLPCYTQLD